MDILKKQKQKQKQKPDEHFWAEDLPKGWHYEFLSNLIETYVDNRGKSIPTSEYGIPLIATNCISNNSLFPKFKKIRYVSKDTFDNWFRAGHSKPGDIIFVNKGTPGLVCMVPDPVTFCFAQDMIALRPNKIVTGKYLFTVLRSDFIQKQIEGFHVGTLIPHLKKTDFDNIIIPIPTRGEQENIGNLYYKLSLSLELLEQQNQILEKIIQTIFKSWFVNFDGQTEFVDSELGPIPKGWKVIQLENLVELIKGVSYRSEDLQTSNNALVTLKSINRGGGYTKRGLKEYSGKFKDSQILTPGSLVIAQTDVTQTADVLGKPAIIQKSDYENLIASLDLVIAKPKDERITKSFLYYLLINENFQIYAYGHATGTTVLHLSKDAIPSYSFPLPPTKLMKTFDQISKNILEKLDFNQQLSYGLEKIRDSLLPKLMSGELRV